MRDASFSASNFHEFPEERAAPRRRGAAAAQPAPTPSRAQKKKPSALARVFGPQRMGKVLLLGIGGLALIGVPMNALFFQDGHHPAPLFQAHSVALAPQKVESEKASPPPAAPRPVQAESARVEAVPARPDPIKAELTRPEAVNKLDAARTAAPARAPKAAKNDAAALTDLVKSRTAAAPAPKPVKKKEAAHRDPINALIAGGDAGGAQSANGDVLAAQRALQRLGYVVKPNGVMSGGTKQAIEKFEKDNGLPAKGELSPKVVKLLSARAAEAQQ